MKKLIFVLALSFIFTGVATATEEVSTSTPVVMTTGNGSPDLTVSAWGLTNSQMVKIARGATMKLANGTTYTCPTWFPMYCVDVSATAWYKARFK